MSREWEEFETIEVIGVGTVGTIYRARDIPHDRIVALKILHPTVSEDQIIQARFEREMLILEKLKHKNIVEYYGGGKHGKQLFFAMELVDGGSLSELMEQTGRLTWFEAASCGVQICSALQHAHNFGVIHRDLKPANLLFTADGQLKLADFGIAMDTHQADITAKGLTVGTYKYMSPEQIRGDRLVSGQMDLYSLGCLLFEMITGRPPYQGENFAMLFEQHLRSAPPDARQFVDDCPDEMAEIICHLLAKKPESRPFNARAVQGVLLQLLGRASEHVSRQDDVAASEAVDVGRRSLSERIHRVQEIKRGRSTSWTPLVVLLLIVVGVICAATFLAD